MDVVDTVVVGAGQAGLAVSHLLREAGVGHVVYERGRVAESWRSQRWDSFTLNTPNWATTLPGLDPFDESDDSFTSRDDLVELLEHYAEDSRAPVVEQTAVTSVERSTAGRFRVVTSVGEVEARNVVVCSGSQNAPRVPGFAARLPTGVLNLTAGTYRNPSSLPEGAVVVVGSGQSGCQIVEDLLAADRTVFLSVSRVARVPRRYRGRDILSWLRDMGLFDTAVQDLEDPNLQYAAQPQVSGTNGGHTISLQSLARDGARLIGRVEDLEGATLQLRPHVPECVTFADAACAELKEGIDTFIATNGIDAPPGEPDLNEPEMVDLHGTDAFESLDLVDAGISTVIWCVGFGGDFSWIRHDILDAHGVPRHERGVSDDVPGLYFVGFPWLSKRKSGIILGVTEDARRVVDHLTSATV